MVVAEYLTTYLWSAYGVQCNTMRSMLRIMKEAGTIVIALVLLKLNKNVSALSQFVLVL